MTKLVALITASTFVVLSTVGCATHKPPVVFPDDIPPQPTVEIPDLPDVNADSCPEIAIEAGRRIDVTVSDNDGIAECTGVVEPLRAYVGGIRADILNQYHVGLYVEMRHDRSIDRATCQDAVDNLWKDGIQLRREGDAWRIIVPGVAVLSAVIGFAIGYGIGQVAP